MPLAVGEVVANKYRVESILGSGGMGVVVAARHIELDEAFAIKVMLPEVMAQPALVQRFLREARAAVRLKGRHVARVVDVDRLPDGTPYIVMEHLAGADLRTVLERRGRLPAEEAAGLVMQACDAVAEAHAAGIVHRDLKPANLFLADQSDGEPMVKVLDFGISKMQSENDGAAVETGLTKSHAMLGSVRYMSPEQMRSSRDVDHRTDIWSLGVTLFELLTGRTPFLGTTVHEISAQVLRDQVPDCRAIEPSVPAGLGDVVMRCLQKDPADRFANMGELAEQLAPFSPIGARGGVERIVRLSRSVKAARSSIPDAAPELDVANQNGEVTILERGRSAATTVPERVDASGAPSLDATDTSAELVPVVPPGRLSRRATALILAVIGIAIAIGLGLWARAPREDGGSPVSTSPQESTSPRTLPAPPDRPSVAPPEATNTAVLPAGPTAAITATIASTSVPAPSAPPSAPGKPAALSKFLPAPSAGTGGVKPAGDAFSAPSASSTAKPAASPRPSELDKYGPRK